MRTEKDERMHALLAAKRRSAEGGDGAQVRSYYARAREHAACVVSYGMRICSRACPCSCAQVIETSSSNGVTLGLLRGGMGGHAPGTLTAAQVVAPTLNLSPYPCPCCP